MDRANGGEDLLRKEKHPNMKSKSRNIHLVAVALIALPFLAACEPEEEVVVEDVGAVEEAPEVTTPALVMPMTDVVVIAQEPDATSLVGQRVELEDVEVVKVTGDQAFTIAAGDTGSILVILDQVATPQTETEGRYDVNPGDTVTIMGEVRELASMEQAMNQWNLSGLEESDLATSRVYIHADALEMGGSDETMDDAV